MKKSKEINFIKNKLVILIITLVLCLSSISLINITSADPGPDPIVDGVISPGEYDDALYIELTGPWPPEAPFSPSAVDGYLYWDTQYLWIAVDEPFPNWGSGLRDNFVEFMWDPGASSPDLHAWVLWDDTDWSHVICPKWGCWTVTSDPYPGTSWWAVDTAVEFKFDYTLYGTSYGDSIQFIVDTAEDAHLYPPFGDCQIWPENPTYYPCETESSVETWGTIVLDGNQPPVADANGPYNGLVDESIVLDGSGSYDLDGTIASYEWDLNNDGIYDDATGETPSQSWAYDGTYPISLKVTDDGGLSDTDDTTVNIGEHAVDGLINPDEYDGGIAVELVGEDDPGFTIDAVIDWDSQFLYVGVNESVADYIEFTFDAGPHTDYLDAFALFSDGSISHLTCGKESGSWTADSYVFEALSDTHTEFKVDYTDFGISLGDTIKMSIDRGSPAAFWPEDAIVYQGPGRRPDPSTWGDVTLNPPSGIPPVADTGGPYEADNCAYSVLFDGTDSYDTDGVIVSYDWDFGDGAGWHNGISPTPSKTYSTYGEFIVKLRVTDNDGLKDTDTTTAEIYGVDACANGPYNIVDSLTVGFDGSGSIGYKLPLTYSWDFDASDGIQVDSTEMNPIHTYDSYGTYTATITVTEPGNSCSDTATTTVTLTKDLPTVELIYPVGGETIKDTVTIEWEAIDEQDGEDLDIYIYYSDDEENWYQINDVLENTGEYDWDTTTIADATYTLLVEAEDSESNLGYDSSDLFEIKNNGGPENNPPYKPSKPAGTTNGNIRNSYTYESSTTDPDGDQIYYFFDWDDGTNSGWIGPFNSGDTCSKSHIFRVQGSFSVKVKAKDTNDSESVWSDSLSVSMPRSKGVSHPIFQQFIKLIFQRFPLLAQLLSNFIL